MMIYRQFLNKEVVNKNKEKGYVLSFDENHLAINYPDIRYPDDEKSYDPNIAFKNGYLTFIDKELNDLVLSLINERNKQKENEIGLIEKNHDFIVKRYKQVIKRHHELVKKVSILKQLFGDDFIYPPYVAFMRKYEKMLPRRSYY